MSESLLEAIERCHNGNGSLEDYKAAFEFAEDTVHGLRQKLEAAEGTKVKADA